MVKNWYYVHFDTKILVKTFEFNIMNDIYHELSYHQQKIFFKKSRYTQKIWPKVVKNEQKLRKNGKNWYFVHFDTKISIKNYKFNVVNNKY